MFRQLALQLLAPQLPGLQQLLAVLALLSVLLEQQEELDGQQQGEHGCRERAKLHVREEHRSNSRSEH